MTGIYQVLANDGVLPHQSAEGKNLSSAKRKGIRHGGMMLLLGCFIVPLLGLLSNILNFDTQLVGLAAIVLFVGGIVRMIYALIFESSSPSANTLEENAIQAANHLLSKKNAAKALPPQQSMPAASYTAPNWRDTNELVQPPSVTENTTKILQKDQS